MRTVPQKLWGAIASEAMAAIALAGIAVGNSNGNGGSGGSSGGSIGGGGCGDNDIDGYSNGVGHRQQQQSTKDGSGRNGSRDSNGNGYNDDEDGKGNDGGDGNSDDGGIPSQQTTIRQKRQWEE